MVFQETYPAFSREEIIAAYEQKYGAITTVLPRDPAHREDMLQRLLASLRTSYTEQEAQAILTEVSEAGFSTRCSGASAYITPAPPQQSRPIT